MQNDKLFIGSITQCNIFLSAVTAELPTVYDNRYPPAASVKNYGVQLHVVWTLRHIPCVLLLLLIAFIQRYSLLSIRIIALTLHAILNE